jgi:predicted DNA-binding transcriptional regulator YafY
VILDKDIEVIVQIDASCSHYFKRRTMYPTQKIIEERKDGSIIVSFNVGQYEAIQNMLKSWIPHILILKPKSLKEAVLKDVKRWIGKQQMMFKQELPIPH